MKQRKKVKIVKMHKRFLERVEEKIDPSVLRLTTSSFLKRGNCYHTEPSMPI